MKPGTNDIPVKLRISGRQLEELQKHTETESPITGVMFLGFMSITHSLIAAAGTSL
jgi:hypothetical protein